MVVPDDLRWVEEDLRGLLRDVSRSFYLSLRWLPSPVRGTMSLAYLLARASDTFADVRGWPDAQKLEALERFREALVREDRSRAVAEAALAVVEWPDHGLTRGEINLMRQLAEVLAWFWCTPDGERALMHSVLRIISLGQSTDLGRTGIGSADQLDEYTYEVAGCVGEFWTRLCSMKLRRFAREPVDVLVGRGVRFGQGLQLVNILRDVPKDAAAGRSYLPGVGAAAGAGEKWAAAEKWLASARAHLAAGREYARGIRGVRSRFVVWLPLLLGEATLALVEQGGAVAMAAPVKLRRSRVKWIALKALARSAFR